MLNQDELTQSAAEYKDEARKRFDAALTALLALAWRWKGRINGEFSFESDTELYNEALRICRELSDGCAEDARRRVAALIEDSLDYADEDAAWEEQEDAIESYDMVGSHLLTLLDLWIAAAWANGYTQGYTKIAVLRYLGNPASSGVFGKVRPDLLKWGKGYDYNLINQLALIGQGIIIGAARYAEWVDAQAKGALYYVRRRGSNYDCDICERNANIPIPIEVPFEQYHPRCVCYPEYFYEEMPGL